MKEDLYGQQILTEDDMCDFYMSNSDMHIKTAITVANIEFSDELELSNIPELKSYSAIDPYILSIQDWDEAQQSKWFIPSEYENLDIARYVLDQCNGIAELQRAGQELLIYQERGLFPLLRYLKYLVDTMRKYNVVWGVGRGSSVASFVLFLIGVHKINSLYYDLSIDEFLK
jgi:DNA polymerase III alpha subunit